MNETIRDLAIELFNKEGLKPEDIMPDGSITVCDRKRGVHPTYKYKPLTNVASEEVYQWEVNQK